MNQEKLNIETPVVDAEGQIETMKNYHLWRKLNDQTERKDKEYKKL